MKPQHEIQTTYKNMRNKTLRCLLLLAVMVIPNILASAQNVYMGRVQVGSDPDLIGKWRSKPIRDGYAKFTIFIEFMEDNELKMEFTTEFEVEDMGECSNSIYMNGSYNVYDNCFKTDIDPDDVRVENSEIVFYSGSNASEKQWILDTLYAMRNRDLQDRLNYILDVIDGEKIPYEIYGDDTMVVELKDNGEMQKLRFQRLF